MAKWTRTPARSGSAALRSWARARDRRAGIGRLLADLTATIEFARQRPGLRDRLDEGLSRLAAGRTVRVREVAAGLAPLAAPDAEVVRLDVPTPRGTPRAVMEVNLDRACRFDPWDFQQLAAAAHVAALVLEIDRLRAPHDSSARRSRADRAVSLVGSSAAMRALRARIERVAATDFTVLIEGESGTGKELVARHLHALSLRRDGPFVAVNCAALVETLLEAELFGIEEHTATGVRGRRGKFELAEGGTLFLDEVSDLSPAAQAKLLRALQDLTVERVGGQGGRRVNIRVVAATNRSLGELVARRRFRADLYYRLCGVELHVPPLRARRDDIAELTACFLERHRALRCSRIGAAALDAFLVHDWPGNVRELERVIERAVALAEGDEIGLEDLPPGLGGESADVLLPAARRGDTMRAWGSRYARLVLDRCGRNKRRACKALGISYHTLQAYLRYQPAGAPGELAGRPPPAAAGRNGAIASAEQVVEGRLA